MWGHPFLRYIIAIETHYYYYYYYYYYFYY